MKICKCCGYSNADENRACILCATIFDDQVKNTEQELFAQQYPNFGMGEGAFGAQTQPPVTPPMAENQGQEWQPEQQQQPVAPQQMQNLPLQNLGEPPMRAGGYFQSEPPMISSMAKTDGMAIAALVLGILSPLCCGLVSGLPAIILGIVGMNKIKESNGRLTGKGFCIAGIICGSAGIVFMILLVVIGLIADGYK